MSADIPHFSLEIAAFSVVDRAIHEHYLPVFAPWECDTGVGLLEWLQVLLVISSLLLFLSFFHYNIQV